MDVAGPLKALMCFTFKLPAYNMLYLVILLNQQWYLYCTFFLNLGSTTHDLGLVKGVDTYQGNCFSSEHHTRIRLYNIFYF